ncbi:hypothetical protein H3292_23375, partial [Providencia stuartii]
LRDALKTFAQARSDEKPVNPQFKLIDSMASIMVGGIADRYWTEHTGVRTGDDGMQRFWDEADTASDLDDLFNADS